MGHWAGLDGVENLAPNGIRSPYRSARSESMYGLSYRGPQSFTETRLRISGHKVSVLHTPRRPDLYLAVPLYRSIIYRVIHKSLRDFRPLRYSSRDGHAEGEHVNRGRDTPSFCPTLQVLEMLTSEGA